MEYRKRLIRDGMVLFLIGLLTGLSQQHFANIRMGLAAHLEGVMNGTFLLAIGAIWGEVRLSIRGTALAYWTLLVGTYGNWAVTTIAAIWGTASLTPITGAHGAGPSQEAFVTTGFVIIGFTIISASALLLWGLCNRDTPN